MSAFTPVTKDDDELVVELMLEEEHESPEDHFEDPKTLKWVKGQIDRGNKWVWFTAHVRATYRSIITGDDYLGACSHKNEKDFKRSGYYDDVVQAAVDQINEKLKTLAR